MLVMCFLSVLLMYIAPSFCWVRNWPSVCPVST